MQKLPSLYLYQKKIKEVTEEKLVKDKNLTILFVDDEETCQTACKLILQGAGHTVITASGGGKPKSFLQLKSRFNFA